MKRRIALQYEEGTPVETILCHLGQSGKTISDYVDRNKLVNGMPKMAEYNRKLQVQVRHPAVEK